MGWSIHSSPLNEIPYAGAAQRLWTSAGDVLVMGDSTAISIDNASYHFAIYRPQLGWHGYVIWGGGLGVLITMKMSAHKTLWMHYSNPRNIGVRIGEDGNARVVAVGAHYFRPLAVDEDGYLGVFERTIAWLSIGTSDTLNIAWEYKLDFGPEDGVRLSDGAIMIVGKKCLIIFSPDGQKMEEFPSKNTSYSYHPPFVIYKQNQYLCYTKDPREGWEKVLMPKENRVDKKVGKRKVLFLNEIDDKIFLALGDESHATFYRCSKSGTYYAEKVWSVEVPQYTYTIDIVPYNGLVCMFSSSPINITGREDKLKNDGFLAWNPLSDILFTELPNKPICSPEHLIKHNFVIPSAWQQDAMSQQQIGLTTKR